MKIHVVPYDPAWISRFQSIQVELSTLLSLPLASIHHIGSTSVPDLAAKPIIDILIGVHSTLDFDSIIPKMLAGNYLYYPLYNDIMPYRRYFALLDTPHTTLGAQQIISTTADNIPTLHHHKVAHVHIIPNTSPHFKRHLAFRDYLIAHIEVKKQYQNLKLQLAQQAWSHSQAYQQAKNSFIQQIEKEAMLWYQDKN